MIIKAIGLALFIVGLIITLYTGLGFVSKEEVVEMGSFQITKDKEGTTIFSPLIGIGVMIMGGVIFISSNKRHFRQA